MPEPTIDAHLREEQEHADAEYRRLGSTVINEAIFAGYAAPRTLWRWRERAASLIGPVAGKRLLDYGCGQGEESAYFARLGAKVTAIDISPVGLEVGRRRAEANGLTIDFRPMNCEHTDFPDASFDVVHGSGILHHIGLDNGLREVRRVLVDGGVAVFLEPLQSGPVSEWIKGLLSRRLPAFLELTPVTSGEENLKLVDLEERGRAWREFAMYPYRLTYRARKLFLPQRLWDYSLRFDNWALNRWPAASRLAGAAVIFLRK
jgi:SAM-dependent methyltransferase